MEAVYWQVGVFPGEEIGSTDYDCAFPWRPCATLGRISACERAFHVHSEQVLAQREVAFNPTIARAFASLLYLNHTEQTQGEIGGIS